MRPLEVAVLYTVNVICMRPYKAATNLPSASSTLAVGGAERRLYSVLTLPYIVYLRVNHHQTPQHTNRYQTVTNVLRFYKLSTACA